MKREEKDRLLNQGTLEFWNESVVYYRNMKDNAKTVKEFLENMDYLKVCRAALRAAEKRILHKAIILLAIIFLSGCPTAIRGTGQMISGIGQGAGTIITGVGDYLQEEMEGK